MKAENKLEELTQLGIPYEQAIGDVLQREYENCLLHSF